MASAKCASFIRFSTEHYCDPRLDHEIKLRLVSAFCRNGVISPVVCAVVNARTLGGNYANGEVTPIWAPVAGCP